MRKPRARRVLALGAAGILAAVILEALACGGTSRVLDSPGAGSAPLARVSFSSRERRSPELGDRVAVFDRVEFSSPSAIIHDPKHDVYWVSNLNDDRGEGHGFISRLDPDGALITLNFIDAGQPNVKLKAPRGLAVAGESLFVADVTAIRRFKTETGEPEGSIEIPGAVYLSDVAVAADGSVYAVDVGNDPNVAALPDAGNDAVYQISGAGQISTVARRPDLGGPFAVLANETGLWITCTGTNDLLLLVPGANAGPTPDAGRLHLPGNAPRGLAAMPDGTFLISSWAEGAVYRGFRDGPFAPVITGLESPADLGYDTRRKRLLIPLLTGHALAIFELSPFHIQRPKAP